MSLTRQQRSVANVRLRKAWAKEAPGYDRRIGWFERRVLGTGHRQWACARARGDVLEVAVGTGLNLPLYPPDARVVAIDLSPDMLEVARARADESSRDVELLEADAHDLPFADASFDTVVCTLSLCNIPDVDLAVREMKRVLRTGGTLVLVDHVRGASRLVVWIQKAIEFATLRFNGDHMTRRPLEQVRDHGFGIEERERFRWGIVERLVALKH